MKTLNKSKSVQNFGKGEDQSLVPRKSKAPVKDWTSSVARRIQNHTYGFETTRKHYEREAAARFIYSKFGSHLQDYNQNLKKNEGKSLFSDHIRDTNTEVFNKEKGT